MDNQFKMELINELLVVKEFKNDTQFNPYIGGLIPILVDRLT